MKSVRSINGFSKIDSLKIKGIAILLMMFHHCFGGVNRFNGYDISFYPFSQAQFVKISWSFKICVSIFAFITAYGLTLSLKKHLEYDNNYYHWYLQRLIKLLSGYWFVVIIFCLICEVFGRQVSNIFFNHGLLQGIFYLFLQAMGVSYLFATPLLNGTWWYMSAAVIFVLLIPLLHYIATKKYGTAILLVGTILIFRIHQDSIGFPGGESPYTYLYILCIGTLAAEKNWLLSSSKGVFKFFIDTILMYLVYRVYLVVPVELFWEFTWNLVPFFLIVYCWKWIICIPVIDKILIFLGRHSINIFLVHTFIRDHFFHDFIYSLKYFWLIIIVLLGTSVLLSILIEWMKKVTGYNQWINYLIEKVPTFNAVKSKH